MVFSEYDTQHFTPPRIILSTKDPAAITRVSNLQRCRAAGYLTLAAVAKCLQAAT